MPIVSQHQDIYPRQTATRTTLSPTRTNTHHLCWIVEARKGDAAVSALTTACMGRGCVRTGVSLSSSSSSSLHCRHVPEVEGGCDAPVYAGVSCCSLWDDDRVWGARMSCGALPSSVYQCWKGKEFAATLQQLADGKTLKAMAGGKNQISRSAEYNSLFVEAQKATQVANVHKNCAPYGHRARPKQRDGVGPSADIAGHYY